MMALAMAPLARLPYQSALCVWWAIQAACFTATGWMLYRMMNIPRRWRIVAIMALAAILPVWVAIRMGHLSPILLLILTGGISLHRRGNPWWAGFVFSLLAVKPQFAAGIGVWLLVRWDLRALGGLAIGLLVQATAVMAILGPRLPLDYLAAMPTVASLLRDYRYSAVFEQSLAASSTM